MKSATSVVLPEPAGAVTSVTACARFCSKRSTRRGRGRSDGAGRGGRSFGRGKKGRGGRGRQELRAQEEGRKLRRRGRGRLRVVDASFVAVRQIGHRF